MNRPIDPLEALVADGIVSPHQVRARPNDAARIAGEASESLTDARAKLANETGDYSLRRGVVYAHDAVQLATQAWLIAEGRRCAKTTIGKHIAIDKIAIAAGLVPRSSAQVLQALREARNNTQYPDDIIAVDKATLLDGIEAAETAISILFRRLNRDRKPPHKLRPPPPPT
jgi:HEPN domain-containing protein